MKITGFTAFCLFAILILSACAEFSSSGPATSVNLAETAKLQAGYANRKQYDLLEKSLIGEYKRFKKSGNQYGRLLTTLDLAVFYSFGFVNFRESLMYFNEAHSINESIQAYHGPKPLPDLQFYRTLGDQVIPWNYNYKVIKEAIDMGRRRVEVAVGDINLPPQLPVDQPPKIMDLAEAPDAYALNIPFDLYQPELFGVIENKLTERAIKHFALRHKLSADKKKYFQHFNQARILFRSFPFPELNDQDVERLLFHSETALGLYPHDKVTLEKVRLGFIRTLCLAKLKKDKDALNAYQAFFKDLKIVESGLIQDVKYYQNERAKTLLLAAISLTVGMGADISSAFSGGAALNTNSLYSLGGMMLMGVLPTESRNLTLIGESEYSRELNLVLDKSEQLLMFHYLGASAFRLGDNGKSVGFHREGVEILNAMRSTISTESRRIGFARHGKTLYENLIQSLSNQNKPEAAYFYSENARSRALVDLLGTKKLVLKNQEQTKLAGRIRYSLSNTEHLRDQVGITAGQAEYNNKLAEVLKSDWSKPDSIGVNVLSLVSVSSLSAAETTEKLPKDCSLIEYFFTSKGCFAWLIERKSVKEYRLLITPDQVRTRIKSMGLNKVPKSSTEVSARFLSQAQALYAKLFQPMEKDLTSTKVYLVMHGPLNYLPFEALHDGRQFLVERYAFSYLPSSSILQFLIPTGESFNSLTAVGNPWRPKAAPLPGAEKEALAIAELFNQSQVFTGRAATESSFRQSSRKSDVIHMACHGLFDAEDPMSSRLILAGDIENDGNLTTEELYALDLSASLVVLSACDTAVSKIQNGNELIGLLRGFFFAGAPRIVASLWSVADEPTARLMTEFYTKLKNEKQTPSQALRQAKLDLLENSDWKHPFFWAPFNLYGLID